MELLRRLSRDGLIDNEAAEFALYDWRTWWARENQLAPQSAWHIWLNLAGRGFGKTRAGGEWLREQADAGVTPLAIVGRTAGDVRDVLVEGPVGILNISPPWKRPKYEPSKRRLTWPNGVVATTFTADEPDMLRGPQFAAALADELATWKYAKEAFSNLLMGVRLGNAPKICAMTTPRPIEIIRELLRDKTCVVTRGSTFDNEANLAPDYVNLMRARYEGTRLGRQELHGEMLDDLAGALWTTALLEACQADLGETFTPEMFERIAIAVDPSGSKGGDQDNGDAQGIVVAGKLHPAHVKKGREFVVLQDATARRSPHEWAAVTCGLFEKWDADIVVAEGNYGGDMVRAVLQGARASLPVKVRHTARGKHIRAEPVAALYEQGRVVHVRGLGECEDEMRNFTTAGYQGGASPNRADALVWAVDELSGGFTSVPRIRTL